MIPNFDYNRLETVSNRDLEKEYELVCDQDYILGTAVYERKDPEKMEELDREYDRVYKYKQVLRAEMNKRDLYDPEWHR